MDMHLKAIVWDDPETGITQVVYALAKNQDGEDLDIDSEVSKLVPDGVTHQIVDRSTISTDRAYRDAWVLSDGIIKADVEKAKAIGLIRMRMVRDVNLAALDKVEDGARRRNEDLANVHAKKDIQTTATDALKAYIHVDAALPLDVISAVLQPLEVVPDI